MFLFPVGEQGGTPCSKLLRALLAYNASDQLLPFTCHLGWATLTSKRHTRPRVLSEKGERETYAACLWGTLYLERHLSFRKLTFTSMAGIKPVTFWQCARWVQMLCWDDVNSSNTPRQATSLALFWRGVKQRLLMQCNKLGPAALGTKFQHAAVRCTIRHPVCRKSQQMQRARKGWDVPVMGDVAEVPAVGRPNLVLSVVQVSPPTLHELCCHSFSWNFWSSYDTSILPILLDVWVLGQACCISPLTYENAPVCTFREGRGGPKTAVF